MLQFGDPDFIYYFYDPAFHSPCDFDIRFVSSSNLIA